VCLLLPNGLIVSIFSFCSNFELMISIYDDVSSYCTRLHRFLVLD